MLQSDIIVLSVIIVNYNVKFFLEQCLFSVLKAGKQLPTEVIVVDNCSADGSCAYLEPLFPDVVFIRSSENLGFAKACNLGLKYSRGNCILFLNPDTIVGENCFTQCVEFLNRHDNAGAIGVRMVDENGNFLKESKRAFPSPMVSFFKLSGLAALFPHSPHFSKYYLGNLDESLVHEVDVIAGAFMLINKRVLEFTGAFDEAFFMYGEDIDLSYRIQQKGFRNFYYPLTTILHFKGRSTPRKNAQYVKMFYRAMTIFTSKHYGGKGAGIFNQFLKPAIAVRAQIANMLYGISNATGVIRKRLNSRQNVQRSPSLLVIASNGDYAAVLPLIKNGDSINIIHFNPEEEFQNNDRSSAAIKDILRSHKVSHLLFCEGGISFKNIISLIDLMETKNLKVGIHASGSKGISWGTSPFGQC